MAASLPESKGDFVPLKTNFSNRPLAHKCSTRDDGIRQLQKDDHRKEIVVCNEKELNELKQQLADTDKLAQYLTSSGNLGMEECEKLMKRLKESPVSEKLSGEKVCRRRLNQHQHRKIWRNVRLGHCFLSSR